MEASEYNRIVERLHDDAARRRLFFQTVEDHALERRQLHLDGREVLAFTSCSYLGLEYHPSLIEGTVDAVRRFGTQFSSSRGFVSAPQYAELRELLERIFGASVVVAPTTTLAHQAVFDALLDERDAVVMDHHVHASVQRAATLARARGSTVRAVRHGDWDGAARVLGELAATHRQVWFCMDGVQSMHGEEIDLGPLERLLWVAGNVRLYIDDAHGMSWNGQHGRGHFLARFPFGERVILVTSMAKGFACGGGIAVFADPAERTRVQRLGGTMLFSGPIQPPMLGAAVASARVHLSDELPALQGQLRSLVRHANDALLAADLPLHAVNDVPIRFVRVGLAAHAQEIAARMLADGIYVNVSQFPSVSQRGAGIRITLTTSHTTAEVDRLVDHLSTHMSAVFLENKVDLARVDRSFEWARPRRSSLAAEVAPRAVPSEGVNRDRLDTSGLVLHHETSIRDVDRDLWNQCLGAVGTCSWDSLSAMEAPFSRGAHPAHQQAFHYLWVTDPSGDVVCATYFTVGLVKDDMLMSEEVSKEAERVREHSPLYLTSLGVVMGGPMSEGNHLFLHRQGPWRAALELVLDAALALYEQAGARLVAVRDIRVDDEELCEVLRAHDFLQVGVPSSHELPLGFQDVSGLLERLGGCRPDAVGGSRKSRARKRKHVRDMHAQSARYRLEHLVDPTEAELDWLDALYGEVAARHLELNVFRMPRTMFAAMARSTSWQLLALHLLPEHGGPEDGKPVAFWANHVHGEVHAALLCGLDYRYQRHGIYKQLLFQSVLWSARHGAELLRMGMTADLEKRRFDTRVVRHAMLVFSRHDYDAMELNLLRERVGLATPT